MSIDIFIRSYPHDYEFLNYCLHSIKKFVTNYRYINICVREKDYDKLLQYVDVSSCKLHKCHDFQDHEDYCGQQIIKMCADIYTDADYICYIDSDCILKEQIDLKEYYFENGKIILLKDKWEDVGNGIVWKNCLKELNLLTGYEFMRRLPQIYPRDFLKKLRKYIEDTTHKDFITTALDIHKKYGFSEFNIMGSYLYLHENENMIFEIGKEYKKPPKNAQFWSHDDKEKIISEMKKILDIN
jgi:hypothetical protein